MPKGSAIHDVQQLRGKRIAVAQGSSADYHLLTVLTKAGSSEANTAYAQSVEPLPFHAMSGYPYPASERFPDDAEHRRWRATYNTRPALQILRLLRPLEAAAATARVGAAAGGRGATAATR